MPRRSPLRLLAAGVAAACLLPLAACSSQGSSSSSSSAGRIQVVASTDVWGSVARAVAGDHAQVTSIISNPDQDPHDYEATARDKLAFTRATVAVVNGGGYDDWATTLAGQSSATLVDAVKTSGMPTGTDFNEHVFYSMSTARKVADVVAADLSRADPSHAGDYRKNASTFATTLTGLQADAAAVGRAHPGIRFVATEPVADYLLAQMDMTNITPDSFVEQAETEAGPSVKVVNQTQMLLSDHRATLLVVNGQTSDRVTTALQTTAKQASLPSLGVTETFPAGVDSYAQFIGRTITAASKALG